jgi:uncharacterized membrane protein
MFAGVYSDYESAKADYKTVKDLYESTDMIDTYDAAVIKKKENGKVKIADKHEQPVHKGAWHGAGWGLAAGLGLALFPAAAIGGGLLAATTGGGAAIGAISGHASGGMSRSDLKEMGEGLDAGEAGLIVAAVSDVEDQVAAAMTGADRVITNPMEVDADALTEDVSEAQAEAS